MRPILALCFLRALWMVFMRRAVIRSGEGRVLALAHGDGWSDDTDALQGAWDRRDDNGYVRLPYSRNFHLRQLTLHGSGTFDTNGSCMTIVDNLTISGRERASLAA